MHADSPRNLGKTGLPCSSIGFGTYRTAGANPDHVQALDLALKKGCRLVDTSTNYMNGAAEQMVGDLVTDPGVTIVSKVGYVQGDNLRHARVREAAGIAYPQMVKVSEELWHCIHPDWIEAQLTESLQRLQHSTVDVYLLHNPEYFFKRSADHREYYRRIRLALQALEREVERGRIRWYGISSNTFVVDREAPDYTSLETILEQSADLPHLGVIQFPFNLYEPGAAFEVNNTGKTVLEVAAAHRLGVLVNRPLNAFVGRSLKRLAEFKHHHGSDLHAELSIRLSEAVDWELTYAATVSPSNLPSHSVLPKIENFAWGHRLHQQLKQVSDLFAWQQLWRYRIVPELEQVQTVLAASPTASEWAREHRRRMDELAVTVTAYLEQTAAIENHRLKLQLQKIVPRVNHQGTLSQWATQVLLGFPEVHSVLVGMRDPSYVEDLLGAQFQLTTEESLDLLDAAQIFAS